MSKKVNASSPDAAMLDTQNSEIEPGFESQLERAMETALYVEELLRGHIADVLAHNVEFGRIDGDARGIVADLSAAAVGCLDVFDTLDRALGLYIELPSAALHSAEHFTSQGALIRVYHKDQAVVQKTVADLIDLDDIPAVIAVMRREIADIRRIAEPQGLTETFETPAHPPVTVER